MRRSSDLEARLVEWGKEYGGGRYENVGWHGISPLSQIMKYHGRPPQGLNPRRIEINGSADEVEQAVRILDAQPGGRIPASVLRCEYMMINHPREARRQRLSRHGMRMDNSRYGQHLRIARVHVAAWLHLHYEAAEDNDSVDMPECSIR